MPETAQPPRAKVLWFARLEYRFHAWRERRARARGLMPDRTPFPGYAGVDWVRVLGRVLIVPPAQHRAGEYASVRGWRSFAAVPVGYAQVTITIAGDDPRGRRRPRRRHRHGARRPARARLADA